MRPILVPNLASFVVDELLSVYLPRKPEFVSLVTKSRDAIQGHERLIFVLKASDKVCVQLHALMQYPRQLTSCVAIPGRHATHATDDGELRNVLTRMFLDAQH